MQRQVERLFPLDIDSVVLRALRGANTLSRPELTAEGVSRANDQPLGGELLRSMSFDMNSWSSTLEETFANVIQPEVNIAAEIQLLIEYINKLEEESTNNNPTNPTVASAASDASASSQLPSSEATHSRTIPTIHSQHQSYVCSWNHQDSNAQCDNVASNRSAFFRHLGEMHQVSGTPDETIVCQLWDSEMGSACKTSIKRGNFPRHVDTHYRLRYQCQHCPTDKSFSRQDTWKKHVRTMHPQAPPGS